MLAASKCGAMLGLALGRCGSALGCCDCDSRCAGKIFSASASNKHVWVWGAQSWPSWCCPRSCPCQSQQLARSGAAFLAELSVWMQVEVSPVSDGGAPASWAAVAGAPAW